MAQFPLQYHKEIHAHKLEYEVFRGIYHGTSHKGSVQLQSLMSVYPRVIGGEGPFFTLLYRLRKERTQYSRDLWRGGGKGREREVTVQLRSVHPLSGLEKK